MGRGKTSNRILEITEAFYEWIMALSTVTRIFTIATKRRFNSCVDSTACCYSNNPWSFPLMSGMSSFIKNFKHLFVYFGWNM
jgi:hypothetical protein